jgi:alpha-D-ribose 1-methylphosphonate 5-triphosphate synthase subunit PhnL
MPTHRNSSAPPSETEAAVTGLTIMNVAHSEGNDGQTHAAVIARTAPHAIHEPSAPLPAPFADPTVRLAVRGLSKRFVLHTVGATVDAFRDINLEVRAGRFFGLVGASGSGKSSILKCLYRMYLPTSGQVLYRRETDEIVDLASAADQAILELRRREIRFVSQFLHTLPRQSARDVVATPLIENGLSVEESRERAVQTLTRIGVPVGLWDLPPATFSGGERQLVNMARALVVRPRLLLLDEPTASLDPTSTQQIVAEIERLKAEGVALIGVFHDRSLMNRLADDRLELAGGMTWENTENL